MEASHTFLLDPDKVPVKPLNPEEPVLGEGVSQRSLGKPKA